MVDQFVIGFKVQKSWGSLAAIDFFLGGTGAGAFILSMYLGFMPGMIIGWIAVGLGALALMADLGRPGRFMRAGSQVGRSWISRGVLFTSVFLLFGLLRMLGEAGVASLAGSTGLGLIVGIVAALGGIGVMMYTGFLLSHSPAIPFWNTTLLPLLFAIYGLTSGAGLVLLLLPAVGAGSVNVGLVQTASLSLLAASLVLIGIYLMTMASSTVAARESVRLLLKGPLWAEFLLGVTLVGLVAPLVVVGSVSLSSTSFSSSSSALAISGVLALFGGYLFRRSILKAGVYPPVIDLQ